MKRKVAGSLRLPSALRPQPQANSKRIIPKLFASGGRQPEAACYRRRGAALVMVLTVLALATVVFLAALKFIVVQRKTIELAARQTQAEWLAQSGVDRAAARLAANPKYRGETWALSAEELGGRDGASISIRVDEVPGKPGASAVHVEADYPAETIDRVRQTRDVILKASSKGKSP